MNKHEYENNIIDEDLEFALPKEKTMPRRMFRLKVPTAELKKGAVIIEECDDGDQDFELANLPVNKNKLQPGATKAYAAYQRQNVIKNRAVFEEIKLCPTCDQPLKRKK